MRRVAVTVVGLLLAASAVFVSLLRVFVCTDCGGAKQVNCSRCRDSGCITFLNRTIRSAADVDLRQLLLHSRMGRIADLSPFDDSLYRLLDRNGNRTVFPGDRPLLSGSARWVDVDRVAVIVPEWHQGESWMGLFDRSGNLVDKVAIWTGSRFPLLRFHDDGTEMRLEWRPGPEQSRMLILQWRDGQRRFRGTSPGSPGEPLFVRLGVNEGRCVVLGFGEGLEEVPGYRP